MRKNICKALCSLIFVSSFLTGCSNSNQTSEISKKTTTEQKSSTQHSVKKKEVVRATPEPIPEGEYYSILKEFYETLSSGTELSEEWGNQALTLLENVSDEKDDPETDPYTKENGAFVDPDTAFQSFYRKHYDLSQKIVSIIDNSEKMAYRLESSNPPVEYEQLQKDALKTYKYCSQLMDKVIYSLDSYEKNRVLFEIDLETSKEWLDTFSEELKNAPSKITESVQMNKEQSLEAKNSATLEEETQKSKDSVISEEHPQESITDEEMALRAVTDLIIENYVSSYDPLTENWKGISLDGEYVNGKYIDAPGVYMIDTEAYLEGSSYKQPVYILLTIDFKNYYYNIHFLSLGDNIVKDDGYFDEIYQKYGVNY